MGNVTADASHGWQPWLGFHRQLLGVQVMELLRARHGAVAHTLETALTDIGEGLWHMQPAVLLNRLQSQHSAASLAEGLMMSQY